MTAITWPLPWVATDPPSMSDAPTDDESLVRSTLGGDDSSFAELIRRHKSRVFGICSRFARDSHQLDDLCQEVFLRAFRKLSGFRGEAPFEHWLATLTISACWDFLRKERRHRGHASLDEMPVEMRDTSVEATISAGRAKELLDWAMLQLEAEDRLVLTLLAIEERPVREIAAALGWGESKVKVRAFRARAKLKEILEASREI